MAKIQELNIEPCDTAILIHHVTSDSKLIALRWKLGDTEFAFTIEDDEKILRVNLGVDKNDNPYLVAIQMLDYLDRQLEQRGEE